MAKAKIKEDMTSNIKKPVRNDRWEIIGPGGGGGQFQPTVSPHDPNKALIACDMTGAYITKDGGETWREFNLGEKVSVFYFDPVKSNVIYAGSNGLYRSEDGGERWQLLFPNLAKVAEVLMVGDHSSKTLISTDNWPGAARISSVLVDSEQPDHIFVSLHSDSTDRKEWTRIFYSLNCGQSWAELCSVNGSDAFQMYLDPETQSGSRRLFVFTNAGVYAVSVADSLFKPIELPESIDEIHHASCGYNPHTGQTVFYLLSPAKWQNQTLISGIWKSSDLGRSWQQVQSVINASIGEVETSQVPAFSLLSVCERDARTVYLAVNRYPSTLEEHAAGSTISYWGFIKSEDEGESWKWVYQSDYNTTASNFKGGWVENDYSPSWNSIGPKGIAPLGLGVCPSDPNICLATDMGASYRTFNGGENWEQVYSNDNLDGTVSTRGMDVTTCYGVHFDPFDQDHIVISYTDIGLFHSHNDGDTWSHSLEGISPAWGNTCYWLVFDPEVKGRAWGAWGGAHDLPRPKMFRNGHFHLASGGVSKTEDGLLHWQKSNKGMPENSVTTHLVLDPASPVGNRTLYAAVFDKGVYKSTDDGQTWTLKNRGISGNFNAWRITFLPDGTLFLLVARGLRGKEEVDGAVYKSVDGGETWLKVHLAEGVNAPNDLVFDPDNPKRLYLACWPKTIDGKEYYGGVYTSQDGGETWGNTFDPSKHVYGIAIDSERSSLFINTFDNAAYRSDNGGRSWERLKGYNFKWGHSPFVDPYNRDRIYLTTFGSSVWRGLAQGDEESFEDIYPIEIKGGSI